MEDLTGRTYGYWKVQDHFIVEKKKRKWQCVCRCGNMRYVEAGNLKNGKSKSCGCYSIQCSKERADDLTGKTFGNLEVLGRSKVRRQDLLCWDCICQCGNHYVAIGNDLRSGRTISCGCIKAAQSGARDLTGQVFGLLTAQNPTGERDYKGSVIWNCTCKCGGSMKISQDLLMRRENLSCGCLKIEPKGLRSTLHFIDGTCIEFLNRKRRSDNTTGHTGVYALKNGKFRVGIGFKKKRYYLGSYNTIEEAVRVRNRAKEALHGRFIQEFGEAGGTYEKDVTRKKSTGDIFHSAGR